MDKTPVTQKPKILILATISGGYAGANAVGQLHSDYPANTYILPVLCPSMFPPEFYLDSFKKGIDGIIVMYSGTDSPYKGGPERVAQLINQTYPLMKEQGIDTRRLYFTSDPVGQFSIYFNGGKRILFLTPPGNKIPFPA